MTLADAILQEDIQSVRQFIQYGENLNEFDEYGFTPLIEAAIISHVSLSKLLLEHGADPNQQDVTGGTPLHWAAENNNIELAQLLLNYRADPNLYNLAGQPILVMPLLRRQTKLKNCLLEGGADLVFAQDYINTKLLGHIFELIGTVNIIDPKNQYVEVDLEGFYLEVTIGLVSEALHQFHNHFAARQLRRYAGLAQFIVEVMQRASRLIRYNQYRVDVSKHSAEIKNLIHQEPLLIPVGYEGHAITFIKFGSTWVKCDRREDSRLFDNIMFYEIQNMQAMNDEFIMNLMYQKQSDQFINEELDRILNLKPITELKIEAQISGNCSWANVEAVIPALFLLTLMKMNEDNQDLSYYKSLALKFFHQWREWNKKRTLDFCIYSYEQGDAIRRACKTETLAAVLFQRAQFHGAADREFIEKILSVLIGSPYEYLLKNYLRVYYYEGLTEEGKKFAKLLRDYDYLT